MGKLAAPKRITKYPAPCVWGVSENELRFSWRKQQLDGQCYEIFRAFRVFRGQYV